MKLSDALAPMTRLAINSSVFIDFAEGRPDLRRVLSALFARLESGAPHALTTTLTIAEVMTFATLQQPERVPEYLALVLVPKWMSV